ncbi:MAG: inorganic phosphate transporter [Bacillota bacterium]|nr:inorganic phosphate transporter [Bacillota bacterium]
METAYLVGMIIAGLFFGWTIGSHYTGAVMGTAFGAKLITARNATLLIAFSVILGATLESHNVVKTIGTGIIEAKDMTVFSAMIMMLTAALVTAANTWLKLPVSTSQLAVFSVVGAGLAMQVKVSWETTILALAITWVGTPILGVILGFILTKMMDRLNALKASEVAAVYQTSDGTTMVDKSGSDKTSEKRQRYWGYFLILVCCYAAYTLGCNNTGNAVGVFFGTGAFKSEMMAGFVGGIVIAIGALTWGRPLLEKVGLHIVSLDLNSAIGAQLAQGITAHVAAFLGYPTSMNQAMIGGIAGAGLARGIKAIDLKAIKEIVISWFLTPVVGGIVAFCLYSLLSWLLGVK